MSQRRPPAPVCAGCGQGLNDVEGQRIVQTAAHAVLVRHEQHPPPGLERFTAIRLSEPYRQLLLVVAGEGWQEAAIDRARLHAQAGQQPWLCQRCAGRACRCGAPLRVPAACEVLHDDGTIGHVPPVPYGPRACLDPNCPYQGALP